MCLMEVLWSNLSDGSPSDGVHFLLSNLICYVRVLSTRCKQLMEKRQSIGTEENCTVPLCLWGIIFIGYGVCTCS